MFSSLSGAALIVAALGLGALLTAFSFQYVLGLEPCVLCIYQRWPWVVVAAAGAAALVATPSGLVRMLLAAAALAMLVGAGIAFFHVGVEQHWWAGTAACGGAAGGAQTVEELRQQLMATEVVRCDEVAWSFAGISMAGWNMILSLAGTVFVVWTLLSPSLNPSRRSAR